MFINMVCQNCESFLFIKLWFPWFCFAFVNFKKTCRQKCKKEAETDQELDWIERGDIMYRRYSDLPRDLKSISTKFCLSYTALFIIVKTLTSVKAEFFMLYDIAFRYLSTFRKKFCTESDAFERTFSRQHFILHLSCNMRNDFYFQILNDCFHITNIRILVPLETIFLVRNSWLNLTTVSVTVWVQDPYQ